MKRSGAEAARPRLEQSPPGFRGGLGTDLAQLLLLSGGFGSAPGAPPAHGVCQQELQAVGVSTDSTSPLCSARSKDEAPAGRSSPPACPNDAGSQAKTCR